MKNNSLRNVFATAFCEKAVKKAVKKRCDGKKLEYLK
jgi:hypothetical protein